MKCAITMEIKMEKVNPKLTFSYIKVFLVPRVYEVGKNILPTSCNF